MFTVTIHDFMNLRDVEFSVAGLTLLRGASGSGKSSVLRCMQGLVTNRYRSGCVRWGTPQFSTTLSFCDGVTLSGVKGSAGGLVYHYNGVRFEKVGRSVPEEIQRGLNLGAHGSVPASLHFWNQFGTPWLLGSSCGMEALGFGDGIRLCDSAEKSLGSELKDIRSRSRGVSQILSSQKARLLDVDRLLSQGSLLEGRVQQAQEALAASQRRLAWLGRLKEHYRQLQVIQGFISVLSKVQLSIGVLTESESRIRAYSALHGTSNQLSFVAGWVRLLSRAEVQIPRLLTLHSRVVMLQSLHASSVSFTVLQKYISAHLSLEVLLSAEIRRGEVLSEIARLLHSLSEVRDRISVLIPLTLDSVCPLCGHKL